MTTGDRLLNSLQKTLAEENSASDSQNQLNHANQQTESVPAEMEAPNSVDTLSASTPEAVDIAVSRSSQTHPHQVAFLRGHKLLFPDKAHLVPGEKIAYGNQQYTIKKGSIDRNSS